MPKNIGYGAASKLSSFGRKKSKDEKSLKKKKKKKPEHELDGRMRKQLKDAGYSDEDVESLMRKKRGR